MENRYKPPPLAIGAADVAAMLGMTTGSFYTRRAALEADGFPPRLPGLARWSRPAIADWIARNGRARREISGDTAIDIRRAGLEGEYAT